MLTTGWIWLYPAWAVILLDEVWLFHGANMSELNYSQRCRHSWLSSTVHLRALNEDVIIWKFCPSRNLQCCDNNNNWWYFNHSAWILHHLVFFSSHRNFSKNSPNIVSSPNSSPLCKIHTWLKSLPSLWLWTWKTCVTWTSNIYQPRSLLKSVRHSCLIF